MCVLVLCRCVFAVCGCVCVCVNGSLCVDVCVDAGVHICLGEMG